MFQVAYGQIGLDRNSFFDMTLKEFFLCWIGYQQKVRDGYAAQFELHRFNAFYGVFTKQQAQELSKVKNPYKTFTLESTTPMTMDEVLQTLPRGLN